jgi:Putative addiction module component
MSPNLDQIYEEALKLPDESKTALAERIVEYLETRMPKGLEDVHLDTVRRRREEVKKGILEPVDGSEASVLAQRIINR